MPSRCAGRRLRNNVWHRRFVIGVVSIVCAVALWEAEAGAAVRASAGAELLGFERMDTDRSSAALRVSLDTVLPLTAGAAFVFALEGRTPHVSGEDFAADLRELALAVRSPSGRLKAGISKEFWGVVESRRLVDVINQIDLRFEPDGTAKLGQPLVSLTAMSGGLAGSVYLLPCYRPLASPPDSHPFASRTGFGDDHVVTPFRCGERLDTALRVTTASGPLDLGLAFFNGHSRDPVVASDETAGYPVITRTSVDAQVTVNALLLKLEALREDGAQRRSAHVAGFEYIIGDTMSSGADLGVLYENLAETACPPFTCGHMAGLRLVLNDVAGSEVLVTALHDRVSDEVAYLLRGRRRLSSHYTADTEFRRAPSMKYLRVQLAYWF